MNVSLQLFSYIEQKWLHPFDGAGANDHLGYSLAVLADQLKTHLQNGQDKQTWECYDRLRRQAFAQYNQEEIGEVDIICAGVELDIGRTETAIKRLEDAIKRFRSDDHRLAVAEWLLGVVYWRSGENSSWLATAHWENTRQIFNDLRDFNNQTEAKRRWYERRCAEIEVFLKDIRSAKSSQASGSPTTGKTATSDQAGEESQNLSDSDQPGGEENPAVGEPIETTAPASQPDDHSEPPKPTSSGWLKTFPVMPGPVSFLKLKQNEGQNADRYDHVLVPFELPVKIGADFYTVSCLPGFKEDIWSGGGAIYVIQVKEDSLNNNNPPIAPGDYLIIHSELAWKPEDVVVITRVGKKSDRAKTYQTDSKWISNGHLFKLVSDSGGKIRLVAKSTNPDYHRADGQDREFVLKKVMHGSITIQVAFAMLKKLEPETT